MPNRLAQAPVPFSRVFPYSDASPSQEAPPTYYLWPSPHAVGVRSDLRSPLVYPIHCTDPYVKYFYTCDATKFLVTECSTVWPYASDSQNGVVMGRGATKRHLCPHDGFSGVCPRERARRHEVVSLPIFGPGSHGNPSAMRLSSPRITPPLEVPHRLSRPRVEPPSLASLR